MSLTMEEIMRVFPPATALGSLTWPAPPKNGICSGSSPVTPAPILSPTCYSWTFLLRLYCSTRSSFIGLSAGISTLLPWALRNPLCCRKVAESSNMTLSVVILSLMTVRSSTSPVLFTKGNKAASNLISFCDCCDSHSLGVAPRLMPPGRAGISIGCAGGMYLWKCGCPVGVCAKSIAPSLITPENLSHVSGISLYFSLKLILVLVWLSFIVCSHFSTCICFKFVGSSTPSCTTSCP